MPLFVIVALALAFAAVPEVSAACDPGTAAGALRPKAGLRSAPDFKAKVTSWLDGWADGCFGAPANGFRFAKLADGRTGYVLEAFVAIGERAPADALATHPPPPAAAAAPAAVAAAPAVAPAASPVAPAPAVAETQRLALSPTAAPGYGPAVNEAPQVVQSAPEAGRLAYSPSAAPTYAAPAPAPAPATVYTAPPARQPSPYAGSQPPATAPAAAPGQFSVGRAGPGGIAVGFDQDLDSDKIRQAWAKKGGSIGSYEVDFGASLMYLGTDQFTMTGAGFTTSIRLNRMNYRPPSYERNEHSWFATKFGIGADLGVFGATMEMQVPDCYYSGYSYYCSTTTQQTSVSMSQFSLVGTFGIVKAVGAFKSPTRWEGVAFGLEWAPTYTTTTTTMEDGSSSSASTFNLTGFAVSLESGSSEAIVGKMGKKAHFKMAFFMLPPVSKEVPLIANVTLGWVWY